jgi:hypothetical protein
MFKKLFLFLSFIYFLSCNPKLHIVGSGMRHHNLSQNKYQPGKHRKKVKVGSNQYSPVWLILRKH